MRHKFSSYFRGIAAQNLLDRPESGLIKPFRERHNIRCHDTLILLRPRTAGQLVRLDVRENGKVQERDLIGQLFRRYAQHIRYHRVCVMD